MPTQDQNTEPRTIMNVMPIETYLVQYGDADGKPDVRLVFKCKDVKDCFILALRVRDGDNVTNPGTEWFTQKLNDFLAKQKRKTVGIAEKADQVSDDEMEPA